MLYTKVKMAVSAAPSPSLSRSSPITWSVRLVRRENIPTHLAPDWSVPDTASSPSPGTSDQAIELRRVIPFVSTSCRCVYVEYALQSQST
eukprot:4106569-Pyramimonas_sp.AAC.1